MVQVWNESDNNSNETWFKAYEKLVGHEFRYKDVDFRDTSDAGEYQLVMMNGWRIHVISGASVILKPKDEDVPVLVV